MWTDLIHGFSFLPIGNLKLNFRLTGSASEEIERTTLFPPGCLPDNSRQVTSYKWHDETLVLVSCLFSLFALLVASDMLTGFVVLCTPSLDSGQS